MPSIVGKFYPRAWENRVSPSNPAIKVNRVNFFKAAALNFVLLQLLFLCLFCYLFGALFQQTSRTHNLEILWVDYDGGAIGDAVRDAYKTLQSPSFPTLIERPKSEYPSVRDLREAVCSTKYWAALYTSTGSSESLALAISGSSTSNHNQSNVLSYIWNEARYPTVVDGAIAGSLQALSNGARVAYITGRGSSVISAIPSNNPAALSAFANPWLLSSINIQPTTQGTRTVYNSICIVLILIQDFFYLAIVNGLYIQFKIYNKISPIRIIVTRDLISGVFTMIGALLLTAAIWAFKANWDVSGKQFALNWLIIWLFAHVNFLTIDIFTLWLPPQYISFALITWVILNVTSILVPFSLSSPFYRWAYALPAHEAYEALTDNWSSGCNPHLYYALPILFAYEISGLFWTSVGVFKRCHFAVIAEEAAEEATKLRVEAALKFELENGGYSKHGNGETALEQDARGELSGAEKVEGDVQRPEQREMRTEHEARQQAQRDVEELENKIERMETRASRADNLGPSFRLMGSQLE